MLTICYPFSSPKAVVPNLFPTKHPFFNQSWPANPPPPPPRRTPFHRAQSWPKFLGASWLPDFSIWEPGTMFRGQLATIDLITQNG